VTMSDWIKIGVEFIKALPGPWFELRAEDRLRLTGAGLFTLLFAEAVRAPRVGMIVPRIMLA